MNQDAINAEVSRLVSWVVEAYTNRELPIAKLEQIVSSMIDAIERGIVPARLGRTLMMQLQMTRAPSSSQRPRLLVNLKTPSEAAARYRALHPQRTMLFSPDALRPRRGLAR